MNLQIGYTLKEARKKHKLTLAQLAEQTGLSTSYLSLLERGLNSPTVENLNRVCAALNLTLSDLITQMEAGPTSVVKTNQRRTIFSGDGFTYEAATDGSHLLSCIVMTVQDKEIHDSTAHATDEIGYVVSGALAITVDSVEHSLQPGDCIYIEAGHPHSYRKDSADDCVSIWFSYSTSHASQPPTRG